MGIFSEFKVPNLENRDRVFERTKEQRNHADFRATTSEDYERLLRMFSA